MFNRKENTFFKRLLSIVACFVLGLFVLLNSNFIQNKVSAGTYPILMSQAYKLNTESINMEFRKMIIHVPDISSVVLYKFVQGEGTSMYAGQVNITSETSDGTKLPNDSSVVPMVDGTNNIQEILLNNIHYENIATIQLLCENRFDTAQLYSCERYKKIGSKYKSIVSIPIIQNIDVGVVGYVMITLGSEYDNHQVQDLVNKLRPYITNIQPLVK